MAERPSALRVEGVWKAFRRKPVLKDASLTASPGSLTSVMGINGSGKTTLLAIAAGIQRSDRGIVTLDGVPQTDPSLARMARMGLMYVPQGQLVVPAYRVSDHFQAVASRFGQAQAEAAISATRIDSLLAQHVSELSGGERMRVSLAVAMARRPSVLLADEPLTGLDPIDQEALGSLLRGLADAGTAVVTTGHDVRTLLDIADAIVWVDAGTTHALGPPELAWRHERFRAEYLGPGFRPN